MSKHTPAPWIMEFRPGHWERRWEISAFDGSCICVGDDWETSFRSEGDANARLIAAAPELLEALEGMVSEFDGCYADGEPAMIKARAAIAKARGEA